MIYYGPKEMARSFRTVRGNTIQVAEEIPEQHYGFRAAPETRSVAQTLVHVAIAPRIQKQIHIVEHRSTLVGFDFFAMMSKMAAEEATPRSKAEILDLLHTEGDEYARVLESVSDSFLAETVDYPEGMTPAQKSRFEMLIAPKEHEMHHRAQLMLIERLLGITPHLTRHMQERIAAMQAAAKTAQAAGN